MRRFHAIAVDMHLATTHSLRCEGARLEKPRTPQPLVHAVAIGRR
jgi:hypothetical protein